MGSAMLLHSAIKPSPKMCRPEQPQFWLAPTALRGSPEGMAPERPSAALLLQCIHKLGMYDLNAAPAALARQVCDRTLIIY
jgi:hypothetical protein